MTVWIFAVCVFFIVFQLVCCFAFRRIPLKLLPLYLLVLMWLYCLIEYIGAGFDRGPWSGLWALVLAILCGFASVSLALAWAVYGLVTLWKTRKKKAERQKKIKYDSL